jgi:hypothetical protein
MGRLEKKYNKKDESKEVKRLFREWRRVQEAQRNLNWIELEKPIFLGYIKRFKLREDVAKRKDAHIFVNILEKINNHKTCKNKEFIGREWKTGKKVPVVVTLKKINKKEFNKLSKGEQKYFREYYSHKAREWRYEFTQSHFYETYIEKHYAYKVKEHDAVLAKKERELANKFERDNLWAKLRKHVGFEGSTAWDKISKQQENNKKKRTALREVLGSIDNKIYRVKI